MRDARGEPLPLPPVGAAWLGWLDDGDEELGPEEESPAEDEED